MASFAGWKQAGENLLDYMMRHRPTPDLELSAGLHDLENVFPGIYGKHASDYKTFSSDPRVDIEAMRVINAVKGNPEAMVDIYRAVPKGVRDFNPGDWVTTSKAYAKGHGQNVLNGEYDLIKTKARAADIAEPGDSIAEQGYWGLPVKGMITKGLLPLMAAGGALAAMSPGSAQASEAEWPKQAPDGRLVWPADMPGYRNTEPGLEAPLVDPVDIATAPIGMTTAAGKALAMAAEPGLAYGTDKALGALLGLFQRNRRTGGGGGV